MKKIGREVPFRTTELNKPRNGEGSFIRLKSGAILYGFTGYQSDNWYDDAPAKIYSVISYDEGETWGEKKVMIASNEGNVNVMSLSFLRMGNGDIGAFYIQKNLDGTDRIALIRSSDEAETWSEPLYITDCLDKQDYFVLNNDRVLRLKSGRIIFASSRHTCLEGDEFKPGSLNFFISDDDGKTWRKTEREIFMPCKSDGQGFQEPGLYEMGNGKLWCYTRTAMGTQWECFSEDGGETWGEIGPNRFFTSPLSPMLIKDAGKYTVAIFNPISQYTTRPESEPWGRTPYVLAVSYDRGETFLKEDVYYLEDDLTHGYCYPALIEGDDYFLVAYYRSNENGHCLADQKITKINYSEIEK